MRMGSIAEGYGRSRPVAHDRQRLTANDQQATIGSGSIQIEPLPNRLFDWNLQARWRGPCDWRTSRLVLPESRGPRIVDLHQRSPDPDRHQDLRLRPRRSAGQAPRSATRLRRTATTAAAPAVGRDQALGPQVRALRGRSDVRFRGQRGLCVRRSAGPEASGRAAEPGRQGSCSRHLRLPPRRLA